MSDEKKYSIEIPGPPVTAATTTSSTLDAGSTIGIAQTHSYPVKPPFPTELLILCPKLTDPNLIILKYAIEMYRIARWRLKEGNLTERHIRNSVAESAVIHARNLCAFFCDRKKFEDDLTLADITDVNQARIPELRNALRKAYDERHRN